jgi:hypothetical protein
MPLFGKRVDPHRLEFERNLTPAEVEKLASDAEIRVLQCASPVEPHTWDLLNEGLFVRRPEIDLRVYGFYSTVCDLSFLNRLGNVRRFSADCLRNAVGMEHRGSLEKLNELSVGVYNLESFDFLKLIPAGIKSLSLGATKSKKPRLDLLARFHFPEQAIPSGPAAVNRDLVATLHIARPNVAVHKHQEPSLRLRLASPVVVGH